MADAYDRKVSGAALGEFEEEMVVTQKGIRS
jgi:hypothetical protein